MSKIYITIIILTIILAGFMAYNRFAYLHVVVKFDNLEPFEKQVPVYYKGFKVGKSVKIYPDKNYINTYLKLKLAPADVQLPDNIIARLQKSNQTNYINLIPPDEASTTKIKEGDVIQGSVSKDINSILNDKLASGTIDSIIDNASNLMESSNTTVQELGAIFSQINDIISDVKGDIKKTTSNLAETSSNLKNISANLNNSLKKDTMENSAGNIEQSAKNIKEITDNLNSVTAQIDKTTVPIVNSVLCNTNCTMQNTAEITQGVKTTLKKHFGLGRLIFGRPIGNDCGCN